MSKLAVLSDIHGNLTALEAVLTDLATVDDITQTWCLGDLAAFGPRPAECVARMRDLAAQDEGKTFKVIGGNTDRYLVYGTRPVTQTIDKAEDFPEFQNRINHWQERDNVLNWCATRLSWDDYDFLKNIIGREVSYHAEGYGYCIGYHAIPGDDDVVLGMDTPAEEALDAMLDREGRLGIGGHTHKQMDRDLGVWRLINVGSVGLSFDVPGRAHYAILSFTDDDVSIDFRSVPYDVGALHDDLRAVNHPAPDWIIGMTTSKDQ